MTTVNKASLRDEFNNLKAQYAQLDAEGKVTPESRALFSALLLLFEMIVMVFLEKTTTKTSTNSSLPSSQTGNDETSSKPGSHKKSRPEREQAFANSRQVESVEVVAVSNCASCGEDLREQACSGHERRTLIDIVFEKVVTHVDAEIKDCPHCHATSKGEFPSALAGPLQYGLGVKAYVLNLLIAQMVSFNRVQKLVKTLIGVVLAEATMLKYILQLHEALALWEQQSVEQLLLSPTLHVDETGLRVDKQTHWVHVYATDELTLKFIHPSRGKAAMEAINIIPRYGGVMIHDCWSSYLSYGHCEHGLCGSHLLRELTFVIEAHQYRWAVLMKKLLQDTCAEVAKRKRKQLTAKAYARLQKRYRTILTQGAKELPPVPTRSTGRRGRIAKSQAHNLWERLHTYEAAVLRFARQAEVAFTNNRAERDLRMAKVKQKVSGCFRQLKYAQAYCRISSYLQTMANRGINPLVAIQMALSGQLYATGGE